MGIKIRWGRILAALGLAGGTIFGASQLLPEGKSPLKERAPEVQLLENPEILNTPEIKNFIENNLSEQEQQEYIDSVNYIIDFSDRNLNDLNKFEREQLSSAIENLSSKEMVDFTANLCDSSVKAKISKITDTPIRNITLIESDDIEKNVYIETNLKTFRNTKGIFGLFSQNEVPQELVDTIPQLHKLKNELTSDIINEQSKSETANILVDSYIDISNFINDYELSLDERGSKIEALEKEQAKETVSVNAFKDKYSVNTNDLNNVRVSEIETDVKDYSENQINDYDERV